MSQPARTLLSALALALASGLVAAPAGAADPDPGAPAGSTPRIRAADADTLELAGRPDLPRPLRGRAAIAALGDDLAAAAELNDLGAGHLRRLLRTDPRAWLDPRGRVFFRDALPTALPDAADAAAVPRVSAAAAEETFTLHSNPGSTTTILLDFDGATIAGTRWNEGEGAIADATHPAWDPSGNGPSFTTAEKSAIQYIWAQVAEDYAPFDVDVTTEDRGEAVLERSSAGDPTYGTRALVTPSAAAWAGLCEEECGGVAYLDVLGHYPGRGGDPSAHAAYQPAWIFPQGLGNDPKAVGEAISHEVGHTLALEHDGQTVAEGTDEYYLGHGSWAPIMGGAYDRPIAQFSAGEYADATRPGQDDVAELAARLGRRTDEAGATTATATTGVPGTAYITARDDVDVYALGTCSGSTTLTASAAAVGPDLDIQLRLLDAGGTVVATADPASAAVDAYEATGLDASITRTLASGTYYARVDGVGNGTASSGYTDYGSLGTYGMAVSGCSDGRPSAPQGVTAVADPVEASVTVGWSAPASSGDSPVTGYVLTRSGGGTPVTVDAGTTSHTFTGLAAATTYAFTVAATNAVGTGAGASASATTASDGSATVPGAPLDVSARTALATVTGTGEVVAVGVLTWSAPDDDGGSPVTGYEVLFGGAVVDTTTGTESVLVPSTRGASYDLEVRAVNDVGAGPVAAATLEMAGAPPAPVGVDLTFAGGTAYVEWGSPSGYDLDLVTGWRVVAYRNGSPYGSEDVDGPTARAVTYAGLPAGQWRITIAAVSVDLVGAATTSPTRTLAAPATVPGAPRVGGAFGGRKGKPLTAGVRWRPPTSTGGAPVTGYQVLVQKLNRRGKVVGTTTSPLLGAGARSAEVRVGAGRYRFAVRARNRVGPGAASGWSKAVAAR